jgi:hypothetical protein
MKIEKMLGSGMKMLLHQMGLEKEPSKTRLILPAIGLLTVGIIVGGLLGRLVFPKPARRNGLPTSNRDAVVQS